MNKTHRRRQCGTGPPGAAMLAGLLLAGFACARAEPQADDRSPEPALRVPPPNADSAAAAKIAFALTPSLDTTKLRVLRYEQTDSGYVFEVSEVVPPNIVQLDGEWTVLVDLTGKTARFLTPPPG